MSNHSISMLSATLSQGAIFIEFLPPDDLIFDVEPLLPEPMREACGRGRPPVNQLSIFCAVFYVLRTGIQWKALPRGLGAALRYFQCRVQAGAFHELCKPGLLQAPCSDTNGDPGQWRRFQSRVRSTYWRWACHNGNADAGLGGQLSSRSQLAKGTELRLGLDR